MIELCCKVTIGYYPKPTSSRPIRSPQPTAAAGMDVLALMTCSSGMPMASICRGTRFSVLTGEKFSLKRFHC